MNLQAFWRHVASSSDERICHRVDQLTGNSEIANLYFALTVHLKTNSRLMNFNNNFDKNFILSEIKLS